MRILFCGVQFPWWSRFRVALDSSGACSTLSSAIFGVPWVTNAIVSAPVAWVSGGWLEGFATDRNTHHDVVTNSRPELRLHPTALSRLLKN